jgi:FkbM family methyltransferase
MRPIREILMKALLSQERYAEWKFKHTNNRNEYYDMLTSRIMKEVLKPGSISVDVGCHAGTILDIMLKCAPNGCVLAFEPIPMLFELLEEKYGDDSRVKLSSIALSDKHGSSEFHWVTTNPGYSGFQERRYDRPDEQISLINVVTAPLDDIVTDDQHIDLIKIDVEGAELEVLKGAQKILMRNKPVIVFEHGLGAADYYGTQPDDIFALLNGECGMNISLLSGFLEKKRPMTLEEFRDRYFVHYDYYYVAHP